MQNLLIELQQLLQQDERCIAEGKLLKNKVIELALQLDSRLLKLLLTHERLKNHFFQDVDGVLVFDKIKFQRFVSNKAFLEDSYTSFKNKIGLITQNADGLYDEFISENKEVVLSWPYKDCVLEGGQTKEDAKRDEIFWNETLAPDQINKLLAPKVLTNFKKYDKDGEHDIKEISLQDNLIIKGNNLLALHSLKKVYAGKIKLIYIDPPYNTGNDSFQYNDYFNHSTWLTFIKNRLLESLQLLKSEGVIFISCDDNEQAYLKIICDEVFGRENFIACFAVIRSEGGGLAKQVVKGHDYVLGYAKNIKMFEPLKKTKDIRGKIIEKDNKKYWVEEDWLRKEFGKYGTCNYEEIIEYKGQNKKDEIDKGLKNGLYQLIKKSNGKNIVGRLRLIESDGSKFYSVLKHLNADGVNELKDMKLEDVFSYPKPVSLIKELISGATFFGKDKNEIILDFFAGSGTTAHAVLELNKEDQGNRRFILCEQMKYSETITKQRVWQVVKSNKKDGFVYCELADANQTFVDNTLASRTTVELQVIWKEMQERAFLSYKIDAKTIDNNVKEFEELSLEDQKKFLFELLDKNMLYVPYSEIEDATFGITKEVKELNHKFYSLK